VPERDDQESLWQTYYASTFNPARVNPRLMRGHMPVKYWRNLPESAVIDDLIASAQPRTDAMITRAPGTAARGRGARRAALRRPPTPAGSRTPAPTDTLDAVREAAAHCRDCPLWKNATQTVFGEGAHGARVMFVGEQPGDQEDLAGKPFVGPAGKLLDRALQEAGVERGTVYVTNAVKHFKFEPRGKRRIHKKPNEAEIAACHQWYERELAAIQPDLVVALGATAARAVLGRATAIEKNRGRVIEGAMAHDVLVTVHPSFLLRMPPEEKPAAYAKFVADLKLVASYTARSKRVRQQAS
jgi:DNA polymerase